MDAKPLFRVLEVTTQAFQPRVLATGNGSATYNAIYSYFQLENGLASPPKKSPRSAPRSTCLSKRDSLRVFAPRTPLYMFE